MPKRIAATLVLILLASAAYGKKKKDNFPALILNAQYVAVVNDPDVGVSVIPGTDQAVRSDVENAIEKWGRYKLTSSPENADLILVVHPGGSNVKPTIAAPSTYPPLGSPGDVSIGIGGRPPLSTTEPTTAGPRMNVGSSDDVFSVYRGGTSYPLDAPPLWRYSGKNALQHPAVPAVEKLRKAVDDAEKAKP
jgi:hypothetical protein